MEYLYASGFGASKDPYGATVSAPGGHVIIIGYGLSSSIYKHAGV